MIQLSLPEVCLVGEGACDYQVVTWNGRSRCVPLLYSRNEFREKTEGPVDVHWPFVCSADAAIVMGSSVWEASNGHRVYRPT